MNRKQRVVIVGAGPAGLTAAYELATQSTDYEVVVLEAEDQVGGISKTVDYRGNKIDIGGHRFFSKSDKVLAWWQQFLPIYASETDLATTYQQQTKTFTPVRRALAHEPHMLLRPRKSRIYYRKKFFDYPLKINLQTLLNIGLYKSLKILFSVIYRRIRPIKEEANLEDFYINRFGKELYETFFKDYTYKVWGKPCREISAEWGRQRVKGLGLRTILRHYVTSLLFPNRQSFANKRTEQTLTEYFLYPQQGPGQLWEAVANRSLEAGVDLRLQQRVERIRTEAGVITEVRVRDLCTREVYSLPCEVLISSMPVRHLTRALGNALPRAQQQMAAQLEYRDFIIVGLLLDELAVGGQTVQDNWLYIQDSQVQVGRLQFFHNWSPHMVAESGKFWLGAEYFCQEGDELWAMTNEELRTLAAQELATIGLIHPDAVLDGTVVRMPKAYPSYVGTYQDFDQIRAALDSFPNLFLIGRNGTHKYNNQDHSMLTAMEAVANILSQQTDKGNIWEVNTEAEYHEAVRG